MFLHQCWNECRICSCRSIITRSVGDYHEDEAGTKAVLAEPFWNNCFWEGTLAYSKFMIFVEVLGWESESWLRPRTHPAEEIWSILP